MIGFITGKHLSRRTFLRGLSAGVALPMLDAMVPALAAKANAVPSAPVRMAIAYIPNGVVMDDWTPGKEGANFDIPAILEPIAELRDDLLVLSGLTHNNGRALGDGAGDHARAAAAFLTGVHPKKTAGADIHLGISVDQVGAQRLGDATPYASLELACEGSKLVGNCDSGYSCAYSNSISWRTETTPNPPERNPRLIFERLFGRADDPKDPRSRAKRRRYNKSILDLVREDAKRLQRNLGPTDRRKLDEYLFSVRKVEQRIEFAEKTAGDIDVNEFETPEGAPKDFGEYLRLMFDLQALAFQTDQTRIITFMIGREGSNRSYPEIGVPEDHHGLSHHQGNVDKIARITKINRFHMEQFAYFIRRLKSIADGDGTLLDHSMLLYGSGIADGNRHTHDNLPVLLAGGGGGTLNGGRHVRYKNETPMTNLYLAMLDRMGVPVETLGDSTGTLEGLSDL